MSMKPLGKHNYFVYILTNKTKKVLYIGVTNDLRIRLLQHLEESMGAKETFAGKYNCIFLVYWERHQYIKNAIAREKEMKGWLRSKKVKLITEFNPTWQFLNDDV